MKNISDALGPNVEVIIMESGNTILCDFCNEDYTESDESGGMIFGSKAVCPKCEPKLDEDIVKYNEMHFVRDTCKPDESFANFVRRYNKETYNI